MAGKTYNSGYTMGGYGDDYMIFNFDVKYSEILGVLGAIKWKYLINRNFDIYLDGKLYKSIEVKNDELPQEITIPASGVMQLKVESKYDGGEGSNGDTYIGFGNIVIK